MPEPWYIQADLHDGWQQRETDYQLHLLEQTLANHAAFDAYNAAHDAGVGGVPNDAN